MNGCVEFRDKARGREREAKTLISGSVYLLVLQAIVAGGHRESLTCCHYANTCKHID